MVIGEDEYKTDVTLPVFARQQLEPHGFQVRLVQADPADKNTFPGLAQAVARADLVLISIRRRTPPKEQLDAIRAHLAAGKPLVGIRTASHAFALRDGSAPLPSGAATWPAFDPEVLGGHYIGHHGGGPKVTTAAAPGAEKHPILRGLDLRQFAGNGSLYRVTPLAGSTTPLLIGSISGQEPEPVAWTNSPRNGQSRVFYTSFGHPDDFEQRRVSKAPAQRHLLGAWYCGSRRSAGTIQRARARGKVIAHVLTFAGYCPIAGRGCMGLQAKVVFLQNRPLRRI